MSLKLLFAKYQSSIVLIWDHFNRLFLYLKSMKQSIWVKDTSWMSSGSFTHIGILAIKRRMHENWLERLSISFALLCNYTRHISLIILGCRKRTWTTVFQGSIRASDSLSECFNPFYSAHNPGSQAFYAVRFFITQSKIWI